MSASHRAVATRLPLELKARPAPAEKSDVDPEQPEEVTPRLPPRDQRMIRTIWMICGLAAGAWGLLYLALTALMSAQSGAGPSG